MTKRYFYDINGSVVAEYEATGGTGYGALKRLNVKAGGRLLAVDEVQTDGSKVTSYVLTLPEECYPQLGGWAIPQNANVIDQLEETQWEVRLR